MQVAFRQNTAAENYRRGGRPRERPGSVPAAPAPHNTVRPPQPHSRRLQGAASRPAVNLSAEQAHSLHDGSQLARCGAGAARIAAGLVDNIAMRGRLLDSPTRARFQAGAATTAQLGIYLIARKPHAGTFPARATDLSADGAPAPADAHSAPHGAGASSSVR